MTVTCRNLQPVLPRLRAPARMRSKMNAASTDRSSGSWMSFIYDDHRLCKHLVEVRRLHCVEQLAPTAMQQTLEPSLESQPNVPSFALIADLIETQFCSY